MNSHFPKGIQMANITWKDTHPRKPLWKHESNPQWEVASPPLRQLQAESQVTGAGDDMDQHRSPHITSGGVQCAATLVISSERSDMTQRPHQRTGNRRSHKRWCMVPSSSLRNSQKGDDPDARQLPGWIRCGISTQWAPFRHEMSMNVLVPYTGFHMDGPWNCYAEKPATKGHIHIYDSVYIECRKQASL